MKSDIELNENCLTCFWFVDNNDTGEECGGCDKDYMCPEWRNYEI